MNAFPLRRFLVAVLSLALVAIVDAAQDAAPAGLQLHAREYFTTRGFDVLVFNNAYDGEFSDAKISGVEFIHHGVRTATNGDVRLNSTPVQWDPAPTLRERVVDRARGVITTRLSYPTHQFDYSVEVEPRGGDVVMRVILDAPLPAELAGMAGFNLEFLPPAYFGRSWLADEKRSGVFPLHPVGSIAHASGHTLVLAPEDPARRVTISARENDSELVLHDGRNLANNGWFVVRAVLPAGRTGVVLE